MIPAVLGTAVSPWPVHSAKILTLLGPAARPVVTLASACASESLFCNPCVACSVQLSMPQSRCDSLAPKRSEMPGSLHRALGRRPSTVSGHRCFYVSPQSSLFEHARYVRNYRWPGARSQPALRYRYKGTMHRECACRSGARLHRAPGHGGASQTAITHTRDRGVESHFEHVLSALPTAAAMSPAAPSRSSTRS